jgi:hypothetical protein
MLRFLGVVFLSLLLGTTLCVIDYYSGNQFLREFARDQSLQIMATVLALNIATVTFITGGFLSVEKDKDSRLFDGTRKELRHNVITMAFLFLSNIFVVIGINPDRNLDYLLNNNTILSGLSMVLLLIFGALVIETSMLVLKLKSNR